MIIVTVRFYTNDLAEEEGEIIPRHAWDVGTVGVQANELHDLKTSGPLHFHAFSEIPTKIEEVLMKSGVTLHHGRATVSLYNGKE
jgi:hypothetical protein